MFFHVCEHVVSLNHFPEVIMNLYLIRLNKALARLVTQNGKVQIRTLKPPRCDDEQRQRAHEAFRALMTGGQQGAGDRRLMQPAPRDCRCTIMWLEEVMGLYFAYCEGQLHFTPSSSLCALDFARFIAPAISCRCIERRLSPDMPMFPPIGQSGMLRELR